MTLAGAGMLVVGSLLPWAKVTGPFFGTISVAGTDGDGMLTLVAGLVVGALALWAYAGRFSPGPIVAGLVVAVVSGLVAIVDMADVSGLAGEASEDGVPVAVSIGIGLWLVLLGAVASVGGCILSLMAARRRPPPGEAHPATPTSQSSVPSPPAPGVAPSTSSAWPQREPTPQAPDDRPAPPAPTPTAPRPDPGQSDSTGTR